MAVRVFVILVGERWEGRCVLWYFFWVLCLNSRCLAGRGFTMLGGGSLLDVACGSQMEQFLILWKC